MVLTSSTAQVSRRSSKAIDVLDSKYMPWPDHLRLCGHRRGWTWARCGTRIRSGCPRRIGCLLVSWANLARLATECWTFPGMDVRRDEGLVPELLTTVWCTQNPTATPSPLRDVRVPKALMGKAWPLTEDEENQMSVRVSRR